MTFIESPGRSIIHGVVFDVHGTLTEPSYKTERIRAEFGIPRDVISIRRYINALPKEERDIANQFKDDLEEEYLSKMKLKPKVEEMLHFLYTKQINIAVMTSGSSKNVKQLLTLIRQKISEDSLPDPIFSEIITSESEKDGIPTKPDPALVKWLCEKWSIAPHQLLVVGDRVEDIVCGQTGGAVTALVVNNEDTDFPFHKYDIKYTVKSIAMLMDILKSLS